MVQADLAEHEPLLTGLSSACLDHLASALGGGQTVLTSPIHPAF